MHKDCGRKQEKKENGDSHKKRKYEMSPWEKLPATPKQIETLVNMTRKTLSTMNRGDASRMIQEWIDIQEENSDFHYDQTTLEDYK